MSTLNLRQSSMHRRFQQGVSLVELMVALTIGLFLLGAVGIIYVNTAMSSRGSTLESQMNEDAALALDMLQQQIRLAGFSNVAADGTRLFNGAAIRGCDGGFTNNLSTTAFKGLTCSTSTTGPDALAVRYEATSLNSQTIVDGSGTTKPTNCSYNAMDKWDASADGAASATPLALADNRYFIANDNGVPSLYCKGRTGTGFSDAVALIPNVEDLQIQYAVTNTPTAGAVIPHQVTAYVDANSATLGTTATNWARVAALRICILARSADPVPTEFNSTSGLGVYRDCNGTELTATDRYLRRAYVTTIQLRNMRPALPADYAAGTNPWAYLYEN